MGWSPNYLFWTRKCIQPVISTTQIAIIIHQDNSTGRLECIRSFTIVGLINHLLFAHKAVVMVLPSLWTGVRLRLTLFWCKCCCFSYINYLVIMLTRYWSLSWHGHLQSHSKSKAWQLGTKQINGLFCKRSKFPLKFRLKKNLLVS